MKKLILLVLYLYAVPLFAQEKNMAARKDSVATAIQAEETANSKDILTNLFRASIDNLLGDDRTYTFNSSFLGIYQILNKKRQLPYDQERRLRQNSFNFEIKGNDKNDIVKIGGGFTFAILNKRNITETSVGVELQKLDNYVSAFSALKRGVIEYLDAKGISDDEMNKVRESWNEASRNHDFSDLDPKIKEALGSEGFVAKFVKKGSNTNEQLQETLKSILEGKDNLNSQFQSVSKIYAQKPLWVVSPTVTYDRVNKQGEYTIGSTLTFGLWKQSVQKPWEFEIKTQFKVANDSTVSSPNYNDKPLSIALGLNKVLVQNKDNESKLEFKLATQYNRQFGTGPTLQKKDVFTLNTTLRVNLYKTLWLPLTLKYDVDKGNLLGLFTFTANLSK
ncbi:hypothetical protein VRU48_13600 [Pedobacter sp. KR3-3]|uniref:Uncharacterized protein n=1 Tax=Pedobacter albus TaxID=3113905 RepID=A0ABU7I9J1_9SPHI|nr:hypothetical protein [Pedobacter sp. KR3-3]MEE1946152.1 hypothetical protein [Pedobacter sp. KR3-3]